jgi:hypothetical protein
VFSEELIVAVVGSGSISSSIFALEKRRNLRIGGEMWTLMEVGERSHGTASSSISLLLWAPLKFRIPAAVKVHKPTDF